ncbi:condensation domain-containing protein [Acrocarpospora sp. B8E8]|uniref:condensation domain-containing protein n=1 Tax=Acrocarpospora sp. B8E8 TaxID=3153572 RepID=UPI00325CC2D0
MISPDLRAALLDRLARVPPERREALRRTLGDKRGVMAPLSTGQERLWFLSAFDPEDTSYHVPWCVWLRGPVRPELLAGAFTRIAARHEVLRARFRMTGAGPRQFILPPGPVTLERRELLGDPAVVVDAFVNRPFDLEMEPPWRVALLRVVDDHMLLCIVLHHIAADGWALDVLMRELAECYAAAVERREPELPELAMPYTAFAAWERERDVGSAVTFLAERLAGTPYLDLPADHARPSRWTGRGAAVRFQVAGETVRGLERFSRRERCTPFMVLMAAFQATLGRAAGQEDFCVGVPVAGRAKAEYAPMIGSFANTLAVRADLSGIPGPGELVRRVRKTVIEAMTRADTPYEKVIAALRLPRDLSRLPLCQAMFALQNTPQNDMLRPSIGDLTAEFYPGPGSRYTKAEVAVQMWPLGDGLSGILDYSADLFEASSMRALADQFTATIATFTHPE